MSWEKKHPLQTRGRDLVDRPGSPYQTVTLIIHKTIDHQAIVSLVIQDNRGNRVKDTRLGEVFIRTVDDVGRPWTPYRLCQLALNRLLAQPNRELLPESRNDPA